MSFGDTPEMRDIGASLRESCYPFVGAYCNTHLQLEQVIRGPRQLSGRGAVISLRLSSKVRRDCPATGTDSWKATMSKLSHIDTALLPARKIVNYLLSETHETGRDKANFFKRFGVTSEAWEILAQALRQHAAQHETTKIEPSPFGNRYVQDLRSA